MIIEILISLLLSFELLVDVALIKYMCNAHYIKHFLMIYCFSDQAWISNHIHYKVWDEITNPVGFPKFNCAVIE